MDKSNVIRSSQFHMDVGDILHYILIVDSGVTPTISLVSVGDNANSEEVPDAVVAIAASDITSSSFTANWNFMENTSEYYLDVATDSAFTSMVAGYNNLSVGFVNEYSVVGLGDGVPYYYRVRGINWVGTGDSSNTITLTTIEIPTSIHATTTKTGLFTIRLAGAGNVDIAWGDGVVETKALGAPTNYTHNYVGSGGTLSISNGSVITYVSCMSQELISISIPPVCIGLRTIVLSDNLLTEFTTHPEWTLLETFAIDFNSIVSLNCRAEWIDIILLQLDNNSFTTFTAHAAWVDLQQLQLQENDISNATDINNILIACEATVMGAGNSLFLEGGTNAAPTGAGITAKNNLLAAGVNVTTN